MRNTKIKNHEFINFAVDSWDFVTTRKFSSKIYFFIHLIPSWRRYKKSVKEAKLKERVR